MTSPIERAARNRLILLWLYEWWGRPLIDSIAKGYAAHLQCPVCEVDPYYGEPDYLEWVWEHYGQTIRLWSWGPSAAQAGARQMR